MIESKLDFEKAMSEIDNSASTDCILYESLGYVFENGLGKNDISVVEIDLSKAYHYYKKGAKYGSLGASIRLADFLSDGIGCKKNVEKAIELYKYCIEKSSSIAAHNLGILYRDLHKYQEALKFYEVSEQLMCKEYNKKVYSLEVALCYLYGIGTEQNAKIAIDQLTQLAGDGNDYTCEEELKEAAFLLGSLYLSGTHTEKDIEKARYYLFIANKDNDHYSARNLLTMIGYE